MSEEYKYNIMTFHLGEDSQGEKDLVERLGEAYNSGWKPTSNPIILQVTENSLNRVYILIYTLAKEEPHTHG